MWSDRIFVTCPTDPVIECAPPLNHNGRLRLDLTDSVIRTDHYADFNEECDGGKMRQYLFTLSLICWTTYAVWNRPFLEGFQRSVLVLFRRVIEFTCFGSVCGIFRT